VSPAPMRLTLADPVRYSRVVTITHCTYCGSMILSTHGVCIRCAIEAESGWYIHCGTASDDEYAYCTLRTAPILHEPAILRMSVDDVVRDMGQEG